MLDVLNMRELSERLQEKHKAQKNNHKADCCALVFCVLMNMCGWQSAYFDVLDGLRFLT